MPKGIPARGKRRVKGEGTLRERADGRWEASKRFEGASKQTTRYGKTSKEAAARLRRAEYDWLEGRREAANPPLKLYITTWLDTTGVATLKPTSLRGYRKMLTLHILPHIGTVTLRDFETTGVATLHKIFNRMLAAGKATSVWYARAVLRRILNDARREGIIVSNPASLVKLPRRTHPEMLCWTKEEAQRFLAHVKGHRLEALFVMALQMGLRRGELMALTWSDVDLELGTLRVRSSVARIDGQGLIRTDPKTARSRRPMVLPRATASALRAHRERQQQEEEAAKAGLGATHSGNPWQGNKEGLVFTSVVGTGLEPRNVGRLFETLLQGLDVPRIRFHDLRHTSATLALRAGVAPKIVSQRLGHASIQITQDLYEHVLREHQQEDADAMDVALGHDIGYNEGAEKKRKRSDKRSFVRRVPRRERN